MSSRYSEYKTSGVRWLGRVPTHWAVLQIRKAARLESGHTPSRSHPEYWEDCRHPWFTLSDVWQIREAGKTYVVETSEKISDLGLANSAARLLPKGTVMLSRTASVGFAAIMGAEMATTQDFANWVCGPSLRPEFLLWVFRSMEGEFERLMMGSTHNTIYMPDISSMHFARPPLDEQDAIIRFLDREAAKIDMLVAEQRRLIELLKEKRQTVIARAVTKGINPVALTKPSGLEWLGAIPAHWKIASVRRVVSTIEQGWSPECDNREAESDEWGVLKTGCVNGGAFNDSENKALPPSETPRPDLEVRSGDILMSRASGSLDLLGSIARVSQTRPRLMLSDKTYRVHLTDAVDADYFAAQVSSRFMRMYVEQAVSGADGLAKNLPQSEFKSFPFLVPPLDEQAAIVRFLRSDAEIANNLLSTAEEAVALLLERRSALITAAVTGQIDVRGLAGTQAA